MTDSGYKLKPEKMKKQMKVKMNLCLDRAHLRIPIQMMTREVEISGRAARQLSSSTTRISRTSFSGMVRLTWEGEIKTGIVNVNSSVR